MIFFTLNKYFQSIIVDAELNSLSIEFQTNYIIKLSISFIRTQQNNFIRGEHKSINNIIFHIKLNFKLFCILKIKNESKYFS